jgi:thiazole synthase
MQNPSAILVDDPWHVGNIALNSRFMLGTARYPTPQLLGQAIVASGAQILTVGIKRMMTQDDSGFVPTIRQALADTGARLLPNTAGCYSAREAIELAQMARELYGTPWIKLEVLGDPQTLQPDSFELQIAAEQLVRDGFVVFPYCTDDLISCRRLLDAGCPLLMPWGAPIGSGQGLLNPFALRTLRERLPEATLIVDAGLGAPSHAARAMELGFDAVLVNSAVAGARDPVAMARAFDLAVQAGRSSWRAGAISPRDFAQASTPASVDPLRLIPTP